VVNATPPAALPPGKTPGTHCIGGWVGPRAGLDRCEKSYPTGIRSPDLLSCSESLYRLRCPGLHIFRVCVCVYIYIYFFVTKRPDQTWNPLSLPLSGCVGCLIYRGYERDSCRGGILGDEDFPRYKASVLRDM
jgi:hypothetical protein